MVVLVCRSAKVAPTPIVREHLYRAAHTPSPPPPHCCPSFLDQLVLTSTLFLSGAETPLLQMDTSWNWGCSVLIYCGLSRLLPLSTIFNIPRFASNSQHLPTPGPILQYDVSINVTVPWDLYDSSLEVVFPCFSFYFFPVRFAKPLASGKASEAGNLTTNDPPLAIVQMNSGQVLESLRPHFLPTIKI